MPYHFPDEYGVRKNKRLAELCKRDVELLHLYKNNLISKKEYEEKIKTVHKEWSELSEEKERLKQLGAL